LSEMNLNTSEWKFDEKVTPVFDEHVRQSVPLYEEIHALVADISCWFVEDNTTVYDIGTSTGEALENIAKRHTKKQVQYVGIDASESMVKKARERFANRHDITIHHADVTSWTLGIRNASYIASILTAQFIAPQKRQEVINKIYNGLNIGGGFVLVEKIIGSTPRFDQIFIELYHEMKLRNGLSVDHVINKARSLRGVQRPNTIDENLQMLKDAGFKDIDIFFKWNNFAGFLAMK
jgi:tRNA (cmo5U34)-methyltransferase